MSRAHSPPFRPHPLVRGGHAQTLVAFYMRRGLQPYSAAPHFVDLPDGDKIVLHDDKPKGWLTGERIVLLLHGLGGCHASPYLRRIAAKLNLRGVRTFRVDLRTCGAGRLHARHPYHGGRSADVAAALKVIAELCPAAPVALVGFSLGGNIALKLAGESGANPPGNLDRVMAVCPPVDLAATVYSLHTPVLRRYDRYFTDLLYDDVQDWWECVPDAPRVKFKRPPRSMREFDETFTAPLCGFETPENYYSQCSSAQFLYNVRIPTLVLAAKDDPLIPVGPIVDARCSDAVQRQLTSSGGHLGFYGRRGADPDGRWLDWRVVDWALGPSANANGEARR